MISPLFTVTRLQGTFDQPQEAVVEDVRSKDVPQDGVLPNNVDTVQDVERQAQHETDAQDAIYKLKAKA